MDLIIDVVNDKEKSIVHLAGEIDVYTAPKLTEKLLPLTKHPNNLIEVNFEGVGYMDSTGLGVFISALKSTKENDSHLKLVNLNEREHRLFKITGLYQIIDIDPKIEVNENNGAF